MRIIIVFILAFILRLIVGNFTGICSSSFIPYRDEAQWQRLAYNLVKNRIYSLDTAPPYSVTALRPPLYPLFLALIYKLVATGSYIAVSDERVDALHYAATGDVPVSASSYAATGNKRVDAIHYAATGDERVDAIHYAAADDISLAASDAPVNTIHYAAGGDAPVVASSYAAASNKQVAASDELVGTSSYAATGDEPVGTSSQAVAGDSPVDASSYAATGNLPVAASSYAATGDEPVSATHQAARGNSPIGATDLPVDASSYAATGDAPVGATDPPVGATDPLVGATDPLVDAIDLLVGATDQSLSATNKIYSITVLFIQALLQSSVVIFIYFIGFYLGINKTARLLAALLCAISPSSMFYSGRYMTEPIFSFLFYSAILLLLVCIQNISKNKKYSFLSGVLFGLASLTRSESFLFLPFLIVIFSLFYFICLREKLIKSAVIVCIYALVGQLIVILPWVLHNYYHFSKFIWTTTMTGWTLYEGNNPKAWGGPNWYDTPWPPEVIFIKGEPERDVFLRKRALEWMQENLYSTLILWIKKLMYLWLPLPSASSYSTSCYLPIPYRYINIIFYSLLLGIIVTYLLGRAYWGISEVSKTGSIKVRKIKKSGVYFPPKIILISVVIYFSLLHIVFLAAERYRESFLPVIFVYAGIVLSTMIKKIKKWD
jgi:hypothetical protein